MYMVYKQSQRVFEVRILPHPLATRTRASYLCMFSGLLLLTSLAVLVLVQRFVYDEADSTSFDDLLDLPMALPRQAAQRVSCSLLITRPIVSLPPCIMWQMLRRGNPRYNVITSTTADLLLGT